jgi:hypothetical protein
MSGVTLPPPLWLPTRPAILRPAEHALLRPGAFRAVTAQERRAIIAELVRSKRLTFAEAKRAILFVPVVGLKIKSPFSLTYVTQSSAGASANSHTFSGVSLGADVTGTDKRYTVVVSVWQGVTGTNPLTSSSTIAGVTPTFVENNNILSTACAISIADTSGLGTTGSIVVATSGGGNFNLGQTGIGVYRLINPISATAYAHTNAGNSGGSPANLTLSINVPSGGAGLAVAIARTSGLGPPTWTWTGLSEDFDVTIGTSSGASFTGAHGTTAGTPLSITASENLTPASNGGCAASWQ